MARTASTFRQSDLTRAVRALKAAGVECGKFEIDPATGKIVILARETTPTEQSSGLTAWKKKHAHESNC